MSALAAVVLAASVTQPGQVQWDRALMGADCPVFTRSDGDRRVHINDPGLYSIQASVLTVAEAGTDVDVVLYVHGAEGHPDGLGDSARGAASAGGWYSAKLGGVYRIAAGGVVIVQSAAWVVGDEGARWTRLSIVRLSE